MIFAICLVENCLGAALTTKNYEKSIENCPLGGGFRALKPCSKFKFRLQFSKHVLQHVCS